MTTEITEYREKVLSYSKRIPDLFRNTVKIRDLMEDSPKWKANEDSCSTLKEENDSRELKNEIPSDDKYDEQPSK